MQRLAAEIHRRFDASGAESGAPVARARLINQFFLTVPENPVQVKETKNLLKVHYHVDESVWMIQWVSVMHDQPYGSFHTPPNK